LGLNGNVIFEMFNDGRIVPPYQMIDAKSIIAINWWVGNKMMKSLWETVSEFKMKSL